jgi:IS5 family transposase
LLVVKHLYSWSFEETEARVADRLVLRWFTRVYFRRVPDDTTLLRWAHTLQPGTLHALVVRAAQLATQARVTRARKLRVDGTVVETTIHYPTDSRLLGDGVRVLTRLVQQARALVAEQLARVRDAFRRRMRSMQRTLQALYRQVRHRSQEAAQAAVEQRRQRYARLIGITEQTLEQARRVRQVLAQVAAPAGPRPSHPALAERLGAELDRFLPLVAQVVHQARTRVLEGGKVPPQEKVVSLFESHTRVRQREKPGAPLAFGRHVVQDARGRRHRHALPDPTGRRGGAARTGARGAPSSAGLWAAAAPGGRRSRLSRAGSGCRLPASWGETRGGPLEGQSHPRAPDPGA